MYGAEALFTPDLKKDLLKKKKKKQVGKKKKLTNVTRGKRKKNKTTTTQGRKARRRKGDPNDCLLASMPSTSCRVSARSNKKKALRGVYSSIRVAHARCFRAPSPFCISAEGYGTHPSRQLQAKNTDSEADRLRSIPISPNYSDIAEPFGYHIADKIIRRIAELFG